ncbi:c-type cytochrome [Paracoccus jeotgali]|uniref:Cytochrome c domain-containing protein n=1 Tax=Paracoccus jeotgali TaxID=2065379 RepID=A0A2K9MGC8_9RHOB|nr:cytochrome c [Paracoccus jeotgali]AUM74698.1 hypothetical protein CYR75_10760 [Paracoccus jeotgali]
MRCLLALLSLSLAAPAFAQDAPVVGPESPTRPVESAQSGTPPAPDSLDGAASRNGAAEAERMNGSDPAAPRGEAPRDPQPAAADAQDATASGAANGAQSRKSSGFVTIPGPPKARAQDQQARKEIVRSGPMLDAILAEFSQQGHRFTQTDGRALYQTTCRACHMEDGKGAEGAGAYPPLAGNPKLRSRHFVIDVLVTGYHGMPRFGDQFDDERVAAVTNYIRTHFGNSYSDEATAADVAALRGGN